MLRKLFGVGALDPRKFMDLVLEIGAAQGLLTNPQVDYDDMQIVDGTNRMNLRNIYANFLRAPRRERLAFIENALSMQTAALEIPERWEDIRPLLRPVLRDGGYLTITQLRMQAQHPEAPQRPLAYQELAPGLFVTLGIDLRHGVALVASEQLDTWGVDFETALEVAISNLRAVSQDPFVEIVPGVWVAPWGDSYAAARMVLPEILQRVCSDPLVCAPNRDTLFVADGHTPAGFDALVALLLKTHEQDAPYPLTSRIFQLEHKTLRAAEPPAGATRLQDYQRLCIEQDLACYTEERALRRALAGEGFYGTLLVIESADGTLRSRAVWTEGADPGYLPPAQAITFGKPGAGLQPTVTWEVPWEVVANTPGMLTRTDDPLPRWKTGAFPSDAWLDEHATKPAPADQAAS